MKRIIKDDYLSGAETLRSFYQHTVQTPDFATLIKERAAAPVNRKVLQEELIKQNAGLQLSEKTRYNLNQLTDSKTFTVTTGHQLCLMGGPMFSVYKILSVIRLAEDLKGQFPDHHFVPVFWIASEDHDAAEIDHYYPKFGKKVTYTGSISGAVGRHILEPSISDVVPEAYREIYTPGTNLAEAHRKWANFLFGEYGLVVLDADSPALKALFAPVMEQEILSGFSHPLVEKASADLEEAGYSTQVHPRAINLFYIQAGRRDRIVRKEDQFTVLNTELSFTTAEIQAELKVHPERFSPNVILRPLYQEFLLPNLAYAGGWGELSYWMQLKPVFDATGVPFPLLLPRMNASLAPQSIFDRWTELGFAPSDFGKEIHLLNEAYLPQLWDRTEYEEMTTGFAPIYKALAEYVSQFEPTLVRSFEGELVKTEKLLDKMEKKIGKSIRNRNPKIFNEIQELKSQVQPDRGPQERTLNLSAFPMSGTALIALLYAHCKPLDFTHQWIPLP